MSKYDALFENEDDIFCGSAKSKFFDIITSANKEIVLDELDKLFEKMAVMELILSKDEDINIDNEISNFALKNLDKIDNAKKSLYMQISSEIICRLDS